MNEKDQDWFFTFGYGSKYQNRFIKINGTFDAARNEMISRFGLNWAFQYSKESFAGQKEKYELKELVMNDNPTIDQLSVVKLWWVDGTQTSYNVLTADLDTFIESTSKLHNNPGVNPHSGRKTAKLNKITVHKMVMSGPYWWTASDLHDEENGAKIIDAGPEIRHINFSL